MYSLNVFEAALGFDALASFTGKFHVDSVYDSAHMRFGIWRSRLRACVYVDAKIQTNQRRASATGMLRRPPRHSHNPLTDLLQVSIQPWHQCVD